MVEAGQTVVLLDQDGVRRALSRIAYEIIERAAGIEDVAIVGVKTRGWHLAKRLAERIRQMEGYAVPCVDLDATPFRDDRVRSAGPPAPNAGLAGAIAGRQVVLVDDVLYTGRTVRAALDALTTAARPARIQLAVLVDRGHRELPIRPDYVGKNIPTSRLERIRVRLREVDGEDAVLLQKEGERP